MRRLVFLITAILSLSVLLFPSGASAQSFSCDGSSAFYGTTSPEYIAGDANNAPGVDRHDRIFGLAGDDRIDGFDWSDCLLGGPGTDVLFGGKNRDKLEGREEIDYIYGGEAADTLYGAGDSPDWLYGGADADLLNGGSGDGDWCFGQGGGDSYVDCEHQIEFAFASGNDAASALETLPCESSTDVTAGDNGPDLLFGDSPSVSHDRILGGAGYDTIYGYQWSDCLIGEEGADWMHGGNERDRLTGDVGADTLYGGDGDDQIYGDGGLEIPDGELPANVDLLDGGDGNDHLVGGFGPDELYGGPGTNDYCRGGPDSGDADKYHGCERIKND